MNNPLMIDALSLRFLLQFSLFFSDKTYPPVSYVEAGEAPFYTRIAKGSNGLQVTGPIALGKVLELPNFTLLNKLLAKEYIEFDC